MKPTPEATPTVGRCIMYVGWTCDEHGDPDREIECKRPARVILQGEPCCIPCGRALRKEGAILTAREERALREVEARFGRLPS